MKFLKLANFSSVNSFYEKSINFFLFLIFLSLGIGSVFIFFTPPDYIQGHIAKIMYIHIPSAWLSLLIYFSSSISIIIYLSYKNIFFALLAYSLAITGLIFNILCIITGMVWGKFTWGVWWAWDPRLTSVFILLIFYILFIYLFHALKSENKNNFIIPSVINLIGMINLPIIKFSVEFYNSLHQKSSFIRRGGISMHSDISRPLWFFLIAFSIFAIILTLLNLKKELNLFKEKRKKIMASL